MENKQNELAIRPFWMLKKIVYFKACFREIWEKFANLWDSNFEFCHFNNFLKENMAFIWPFFIFEDLTFFETALGQIWPFFDFMSWDSFGKSEVWKKHLISLLRSIPGNVWIAKDYEKIADKIYNFKVRPDDIWIVTYPKCGTTWTQVWSTCCLKGQSNETWYFCAEKNQLVSPQNNAFNANSNDR